MTVSIILDCKFIYNEIKQEAYHDHFSDDIIEYADKLESCIINNIEHIKEIEEINKLNQIIFIIKWLRFWGESGFGFYVVLTLD